MESKHQQKTYRRKKSYRRSVQFEQINNFTNIIFIKEIIETIITQFYFPAGLLINGNN